MSETSVEVLDDGSIHIKCMDLFRDHENQNRDLFLMRAFEVDDVRSIEIDPIGGNALIRLRPNHGPLRGILQSLATKLGEARHVKVPIARNSYFQASRDSGRMGYARVPPQATGIRRLVYQGLGSMFFGLSVIGVASPFVPTTPFVLLSGYFFVRSSPELHDRLMGTKLFGVILADWYLYRGMRRSLKKKVLIIMAAVFSASAILTGFSAPTLVTMLSVSLISFTLVMRLPTVRDENRTAVPGELA